MDSEKIKPIARADAPWRGEYLIYLRHQIDGPYADRFAIHDTLCEVRYKTPAEAFLASVGDYFTLEKDERRCVYVLRRSN